MMERYLPKAAASSIIWSGYLKSSLSRYCPARRAVPSNPIHLLITTSCPGLVPPESSPPDFRLPVMLTDTTGLVTVSETSVWPPAICTCNSFAAWSAPFMIEESTVSSACCGNIMESIAMAGADPLQAMLLAAFIKRYLISDGRDITAV